MRHNLIRQTATTLGIGTNRLLLRIAESHPARFTDTQSIARNWHNRLHRGERIPFVLTFCTHILEAYNVRQT